MKLPLLLSEIRACTECQEYLPHGPRPVLQAGKSARILIIGQAPGRRVHKSGVAWDDPSGKRLRTWLGMDSSQFYDENLTALVPMGFCFPGSGKSGDAPPRKECAPLWHEALLAHLSQVKVTLLIGRYAQNHYLPNTGNTSLTEVVKQWRKTAPAVFPLPHPSPRNNRWLKNNPWFETEVVPELTRTVQHALTATKQPPPRRRDSIVR